MFLLASDILTPGVNVGDFQLLYFAKSDILSFILFINKSHVLTPVLLIQNIGDKIRGHGVSLCQMKESELNRQL